MFNVTELINVIFLLNKYSLQDVVQQNTVDNALNGVKGLKNGWKEHASARGNFQLHPSTAFSLRATKTEVPQITSRA